MRLLNYLAAGRPRLGVLLDEWVVDVRLAARAGGMAYRSLPAEVGALLASGERSLEIVRHALGFIRMQADRSDLSAGLFRRASRITWLPPVLNPGKLVCVGLNYYPLERDAYQPPEYPVLFHKVASSLTGHRSPIRLPRNSSEVVYEAELAVVIGRSGKHIQPERALEYVAGYTIANDVGAADIQRRSSQWTSGKMLDTFCPLGPVLVTVDEIPDPSRLRIQTQLNGRAVQDGSTGEMIFDVPALVAYISSLATLGPGDVILTGSPKHNGGQPDPRQRLQAGDVVRIEIEGLGALDNPVAQEAG